MKTLLALFTLVGVLCVAPSTLNAETGHDHDHQKVGGPKGGRLLDNTQPRAEFYVEKDNTATITFYDDALKPVAATEQSVTVIAEVGGEKSQLDFEKKGDVLVSKGSLPAAHGVNVVVQFKQNANATPQNFRLVLEDHICSTCKRAEYACICGH